MIIIVQPKNWLNSGIGPLYHLGHYYLHHLQRIEMKEMGGWGGTTALDAGDGSGCLVLITDYSEARGQHDQRASAAFVNRVK